MEILRKRIPSKAFWREVESAKARCRVGQIVHDARTAAGVSQAELARLVGTTQSVISRLEDADYSGHSLSMLHRIGAALGRPLRVEFTGKPKRIVVA